MRGEGFCECVVDAAAGKNVLRDRGLVVGSGLLNDLRCD